MDIQPDPDANKLLLVFLFPLHPELLDTIYIVALDLSPLPPDDDLEVPDHYLALFSLLDELLSGSEYSILFQ